MKVYIETYGCVANQSDSAIISGLLKEKGFEIVGSPDKSDLNIINTCVVKSPTEQRMKNRIAFLTNVGKPLIVAGCMSVTEQGIINKINSKASMVGPGSIESIVKVVQETLKGEKIVCTGDSGRPKINLPRIEGGVHITQIATGCNNNCSYCIVKLAKGRLQPYPADSIIQDIQDAVKDGCKEIWLTSQDNAAYEYQNVRLPELLKKICAIKGDFTIRVGMMNPTYAKGFLGELIEAYKLEKIQKFLHLPVQSGSDNILKLMNRGYTVKDFVGIVERFRKAIPDIYLSTDVIAGFPGETEEDFQETVKLLKTIKPSKVNISKFGARPGTEAAKMKQIDVKTINERSRVLHELCSKV